MFDNEDPKDINDPESDYQIDSIEDPDDLTLSYGIYSKMNNYLYHYNSIKTKYKLRSLTWLIATFIGYGYVLSGQESNLPIDNLIGITLMSCFSTAGILFLAFLDIAVYHRFIEGIFIQIKSIEKKYPLLSNTNHVIGRLLTRKNISPVVYDGIFYIALTSVLLTIGDLTLFLFFKKIGSHYSLPILIISTAFIVLIELTILFSSFKSGEHHLFKKRKKPS